MITFDKCSFNAVIIGREDKVYSVTLGGTEDVLINNCKFEGIGYSGILNNSTGQVEIKNSQFDCKGYRNPIEGSQTAENGNVVVDNCNFEGVPGNNFINFYNVQDNSTHTVKNCRFYGETDNNIIRLSNKNNVHAEFNIKDCAYKYVGGEVSDYTGFLLCQDYTNKSGNKQDFSLYTVNIENLDRPEEGSLYYVYEDGAGIITDNNPVVNVF